MDSFSARTIIINGGQGRTNIVHMYKKTEFCGEKPISQNP